MSFEPKDWKDYPDESTPISANELNRQEKGIADAHTLITKLPSKGYVDNAIQMMEDEVNTVNETLATHSTAISGLTGTQTGQATAISKLQSDKANKTDLTKKVDKDGLLKTIAETSLTIHTGETEIDCFKLDYGEHLIRTSNAINGPPNTAITRIQVIKTHDEVGSGGAGQVLKPTDFEQGTVAETNPVGTEYEASKYPPSEPLHGSRIRNINPIPITEFSTISIAAGFQYCVLAFDGDKKYLGKSTFMAWDSIPRLTYPTAKFVGLAVKKVGTSVPITPAEATAAKLTVMTLGQTSGGSKQLIAWGATAGDLHTCVNIAGAFGPWHEIGSQLPKDAEEGSTLEFRGGKWVAIPPAGSKQTLGEAL